MVIGRIFLNNARRHASAADVVAILLAAGRYSEVMFFEKVVSAIRNWGDGEAAEHQRDGTHRESM